MNNVKENGDKIRSATLSEELKKIFSLITPYWKRVLLSVVLSLIVSAINGSLAWLVKPAMNGIFLEKKRALLLLIPLGVLILYLFRGALNFAHSYLMTSVGMKLVRDLRSRLYEHITFLPIRYYNEKSSGLMQIGRASCRERV